jgi:nucleoside-diphosphate-sugar epimerase
VSILITGANGFIGTALCKQLRQNGDTVLGAVRTLGAQSDCHETIEVGAISSETNWRVALESIEQVVHLAARVHVMNEKSDDALDKFRLVNVEGTANLARQAAAAGVKRFVYLSSVKVNGESTTPGHPYTAADTPAPEDPYGVSKHEAEQVLHQIASDTGMEVVIIRPPLVYGPKAKGNFMLMMRWVGRGIPLPFGSIRHNRRSLVALDNLVDLIATCLKHPVAANQTFLISDGEDLSSADLLQRLGYAQGIRTRLFPMPVAMLELGASVLGKLGIYKRLCGSLQVDIKKTHELLGWTPPLSVDEGLSKVGRVSS